MVKEKNGSQNDSWGAYGEIGGNGPDHGPGPVPRGGLHRGLGGHRLPFQSFLAASLVPLKGGKEVVGGDETWGQSMSSANVRF
jgi:hypothetical protein